ncbi:hypothetical protein BpHYR1_007069 [Brachionus plicatilis]|uniref:Uncharacterized protein n=1 Tax=Brachionus plicatilis TaxID=10195 RepID=A0A3M7PMF1_BRAPC|nr:hypothetical protein BpHYR1_007069 [Brachionus plicatilis]
MKTKVKDPKVNSKTLSKSNNDLDSLTDELFILPFLSESLIRKHDQMTQSFQKNQKNKSTILPVLNQRSPYIKNPEIHNRSMRKSQPNSAISNKSSKSSKSNLSNLSIKLESQKSQKNFEDHTKSTPHFQVYGSQINGNKFLFLTPEATSINKFNYNKNIPEQKTTSKSKNLRGILKNTPMKLNSKFESNRMIERPYELIDYNLANPNVSPNFDIPTLPKIKSPERSFNNKSKITFESLLKTDHIVNKNLNFRSLFEDSNGNLLSPSYMHDYFMKDYKNRLSQINEESSNNSSPSVCSAWSSSFSSILSEDLMENKIFSNQNVKHSRTVKNLLEL